jgi:hypothetical protein
MTRTSAAGSASSGRRAALRRASAFEQQLHPAIGLQQACNTRLQVFKERLAIHDATSRMFAL